LPDKEKNLKTATLALICISSAIVSGCGAKDTADKLTRLKSVVEVSRISRQTSIEEAVFLFRTPDFKYAFVVQHTIVNPFEFIPKPYEVRAILDEKKSKMYQNFTRDNIGARIKVLLNRELVLTTILTKEVEYVSLGYYDYKKEAYEVAKKIVHYPRYEDLRPKENREKAILEKELLEEKSYEIKAND